MHVGCGKNENNMGRRLFDGFQQSVEGACRKHVDLVDDIDLILDVNRRVYDFIPELTHILNAVVGGGVHFDNIGTATGDFLAAFALKTRVAVNGMLAVDRHGENFRAGGFARASCAGEQVRVGKLSRLKLVLQRPCNMLL